MPHLKRSSGLIFFVVLLLPASTATEVWANSTPPRRELYTTSCACDYQSCNTGTYQNTYTYNGCSGCCNTNWRWCGSQYGPSMYKTICSNCHSSCATCYGSGYSRCNTCPSNKHLYTGNLGYYCVYCTSNAHCSSGYCYDNDYCKSCTSPCLKCEPGISGHSGNGYCTSCVAGKHAYESIMGYDYCYECNSNTPGASGTCTAGKYCNTWTTVSDHYCEDCTSPCASCTGVGNLGSSQGKCLTCEGTKCAAARAPLARAFLSPQPSSQEISRPRWGWLLLGVCRRSRLPCESQVRVVSVVAKQQLRRQRLH